LNEICVKDVVVLGSIDNYTQGLQSMTQILPLSGIKVIELSNMVTASLYVARRDDA